MTYVNINIKFIRWIYIESHFLLTFVSYYCVIIKEKYIYQQRYVLFMPKKIDVNLVFQVARMYYLNNKKQQDIAEQFNISRATVSNLLTKAKEMGIVEIKYTLKNPALNVNNLSDSLKDIFDLEECIVVPLNDNVYVNGLTVCAGHANDIINSHISSGDIIGISWGNTCYEIMNTYDIKSNLTDLEIVPLMGDVDLVDARNFNMNEMVQKFAQKLDAKPSFIYAPAVAKSFEEKNLYMQSSQMREISDKWSKMSVAILALGYFNGSIIERTSKPLNKTELTQYINNKSEPVGATCGHRFNIYGELIQDSLSERLINIPLTALKKATTVIAVATGAEKAYSSFSILNSKLINSFVCDQTLAQNIINIHEMFNTLI